MITKEEDKEEKGNDVGREGGNVALRFTYFTEMRYLLFCFGL